MRRSCLLVGLVLLSSALGAEELVAPAPPLAAPVEGSELCATPPLAFLGDTLGTPEPLPLSCTAQKICSVSGCYLFCSGQTSCTVQSNSVTCDGVVTSCPSCPAPPPLCVDSCCWCECKAAGGNSMACSRACCFDN